MYCSSCCVKHSVNAEKKTHSRRRVVVKSQHKAKPQIAPLKVDKRTREYRAAKGLPTRQPRGEANLDAAKVPGNPRFPLSEWSLTITKIKGDVAVGDIDIIHKYVYQNYRFNIWRS
jgi:hypothetical protein